MNNKENKDIENSIKVTIMTSDEITHTFSAEMDLEHHADIYTKNPIDKTSRIIEADEMDEFETFYATNLGNLIFNYGSVMLTKVTKKPEIK